MRTIRADGSSTRNEYDAAGQMVRTIDANGNCCLDNLRGNVDNDPLGNVDISDLVALVNHLFVTLEPLGCYGEADVAPHGFEPR